MSIKNSLHHRDAHGRRNIRQPDESGVGSGLTEDEGTEVFVERDEHPPLGMRPTQNCSIPRIGTSIPRLRDVVAASPQPLSQEVACAPVDQESHFPAVSTASRESFAITA